MAEKAKAKSPLRVVPAAAVRSGGRSARIVADVLRATAEELARVGYAALRMEEVAQVAGVNKTTVYRRWPTKMQLVAEAMRRESERRTVVPDTGSLRGDLRIMMHSFVENGRTPLARAWLSELSNTEVRAIMRGSRRQFESQWVAVIARGMARGELPPHASPLFLTEVLVSPVVVRLVSDEELPTDEFCEAVIELVLGGRASADVSRGSGAHSRRTRSSR
jgi:AcrR family transcriptional regulator